MALGLVLVLGAVALAGYNFWEDNQVTQATSHVLQQMDPQILATREDVWEPTQPEDNLMLLPQENLPFYVLNPQLEMPVENIDGRDYVGVLEIPTLTLTLPIINEWSYSGFRVAPCRYSGSAYTDDLVIAAHNFNSHFGKLKNLPLGSLVCFTDMDGNRFVYEVVAAETLPPTAVEEMTSGEWGLSLFTCTPGGSYRTTVRCERIAEFPAE